MSKSLCYFCRFGLIVTGEAEREHLPKLFTSLMKTGLCSFKVIQFTGQRRPITSPSRKVKMVGRGDTIPSKDVTEIGLPARRYLQESDCNFVVLVDDLEHDWQKQAESVFARYREVFDKVLKSEHQRASIHFLANMLEAYYLADAHAMNQALGLIPPLVDYEGDVEMIRHPKGELKELYAGFNEIEDGGKILDFIDVEHILSQANRCAWLRTLFAWCLKVLARYADNQFLPLIDSLVGKYRLRDGIMSEVTRLQLENL